MNIWARTMFAAAATFFVAGLMSLHSPPIWFGVVALPMFYIVCLIWLGQWPEEKR